MGGFYAVSLPEKRRFFKDTASGFNGPDAIAQVPLVPDTGVKRNLVVRSGGGAAGICFGNLLHAGDMVSPGPLFGSQDDLVANGKGMNLSEDGVGPPVVGRDANISGPNAGAGEMPDAFCERGAARALDDFRVDADSRDFQRSQGTVFVVAVRGYIGEAHGAAVRGLGGATEVFGGSGRAGAGVSGGRNGRAGQESAHAAGNAVVRGGILYHCPVLVSISPPVLYPKQTQEDFAAKWQTIDWEKMRELLFSQQKKLAEAAYMRDWALVDCLQKDLVLSWPARALAIRAVTDANTAAGVDGVKWETDAEKGEAVETLTPRMYRPLPYRHKEIIDDNGRTRTIHIPAARDKAMQILYSYALDPVAESTADKRSFSARKGRSGLDAHAYIQKDIQSAEAPEWIVYGDVEAYYSQITHKRLIADIPMDKNILRKFLRAGVIREGELFETNQGISLGTSLSPILANMLLDGLQSFIYDRLYPDGNVDYVYGCMTRFADDVIVYAKSEEQGNIIIQIISDFLSDRGLRLSSQKSGVVNIRKGFSFLSRYYQKKGDILDVTPTDDAVRRFEKKLEDLILNDRSSYRALIEKINTKLTKWAYHHRASDAYMTFRHIDAVVEGLLLRRMRNRHPRWHWQTILDKYWTKEGDYRVFILPEDPSVRVIRLAPLNIVQHKPCRLDFNPYLDRDYYELLKKSVMCRRLLGSIELFGSGRAENVHTVVLPCCRTKR